MELHLRLKGESVSGHESIVQMLIGRDGVGTQLSIFTKMGMGEHGLGLGTRRAGSGPLLHRLETGSSQVLYISGPSNLGTPLLGRTGGEWGC